MQRAEPVPGHGDVARGEEGDVVPLLDEFLGEIGDDPFRASVQPGRHAFEQRSNLGDFHI